MLFQIIQEAVKSTHKVEWNETNENSPIRLKTKTKDREEAKAQVLVWSDILLRYSNAKPKIKEQYIKFKIPYDGITLAASIYGNATVQIQGIGCGRWLANKLKEVVEELVKIKYTEGLKILPDSNEMFEPLPRDPKKETSKLHFKQADTYVKTRNLG